MSHSGPFSEEDLDRLQQITCEAEARTAGEIVPYVVSQVDDHPESQARSAVLGALLAAVAAGLLHDLAGFWGADTWWMTLPPLAGAVLGWWLGKVPALGRRLVGSDVLDHRTRIRAEAAFLEEEIFRTRDRTGILIFLALWEHRAVILADEGIHRAVPKGTWEALIEELVTGIARGDTVQALSSAIERCGEILETHGVAIRPDDDDELPNTVRWRDR